MAAWIKDPVASGLRTYAQDLRDCRPLSREREVELAQKARGGDAEAKRALVRANLRFVIDVASKYTGRGLSLAELVSEGNMGLIEAANRFDERKGFKFITYAVWWVRQAIYKALDRGGRDVRPFGHRINDLKIVRRQSAGLAHKLLREPDADDIAADLGWSRERVLRALALQGSETSLDAPVGDEDGGDLVDILPDSDADVERDLEERELGRTLRGSLVALNERERRVIEAYYGLGGGAPLCLDRIGRELGLTRERIRQIRNRALQKMRDGHGAELMHFSRN